MRMWGYRAQFIYQNSRCTFKSCMFHVRLQKKKKGQLARHSKIEQPSRHRASLIDATVWGTDDRHTCLYSAQNGRRQGFGCLSKGTWEGEKAH